jgi:chromosomal replication initiation ATPase DnaA
VLHAVRKITNLREDDPEIEREVQSLLKIIGGGQ